MQQPPAAPDYRRTSRRLPWAALPAPVQHSIAAHLDGPVTSADPAGAGFTPGFAAVVADDAGGRVFAKAAPASNASVYRSYRREAEVTGLLPAGMPVPAQRGSAVVPADGSEWQVLVFEASPGRMPGHPWTDADLATVEAACTVSAALLPAFPQHARGSELGADMALIPSQFRPVLDGGAAPWFLSGLDAGLAVRLQEALEFSAEALAGDAVIHGDLRADNILIASGDAVFCDWNFLGTGAAWIDWVGLLPNTRADGIDAAAGGATADGVRASVPAPAARVGGRVGGVSADRLHHGSEGRRAGSVPDRRNVWGGCCVCGAAAGVAAGPAGSALDG